MANLSLLLEKTYPTPRTFSQLTYDTYCLYDLWWTYGGGRAAYGHHASAPDIRAGGLGGRVDYAFEEAVRVMARTLDVLMCYNVADEATNGEDDLYADQGSVVTWCRANGLPQLVESGAFKAPTPEELRSGTPSMPAMAVFFLAPFWGDEKSGWAQEFGVGGKSVGANGHEQRYDVAGENWAGLCRLTQRLREAIKSGDLRRMMNAIDVMMHAEHNNGSIFNRPPVRKLGIRLDKEVLDIRAAARSPSDFLPYVSQYVQRLIRALRADLAEAMLSSPGTQA